MSRSPRPIWTATSFTDLTELHHRLVRAYAPWEDRIEIAYVGVQGLSTFKTARSLIAVIIDEVRAEITVQLEVWRERATTSTHPLFLAHVVLTACRAWDTHENGVIHSKRQSAARVARLPQWSPLIDCARHVRFMGGHVGHVDTEDAAHFVNQVADHVFAPQSEQFRKGTTANS